MQIGRHVQRLERAQLAAEQQRQKNKDETPGVSTDDSIDQNLDVRYQILDSRNDPVDIYAYVCANLGDPALSVCLPVGDV